MTDRVVTYRLRAEIGQLRAQMAQAGLSVRKAADDMTGATKSSKTFRAGLQQVGNTAGVVGLAAAAGLGAAVLAAANFDEAMSKVEAATHETAANMDLLRAAALKAGADTKYSATEAAGAVEQLAKAGVSTQDILAGGLAGALNLAAAGTIEVGDAAEIAASALTQFGLSGSEVPHVADLLAAGAGKAQGSVQDLGYALKYAGVPAHSLGISIEETTGVLAEFASAGIVGEQAGTTFRSMLQSLGAPTKRAQLVMDQYGISLYDASGKFVGMQEAAEQLRTHLGPLTEAERNHALSVLFGTNAMQGAITLFNGGGDAVRKWTGEVNDAEYAAKTAAINVDNLKGDIEKLGGALQTALISGGDGSQGPLRGLVQGLTHVADAYNKLPPSAQGATTAVLGLTAVLGGSVWAGSKLITGVANMRTAMSELGLTADVTKAKLTAVGTTAAGLGFAFAAVESGFQVFDEWKRFNETADETAKSVSELEDILGRSQVGAYAKDLDIDVAKLAQSLVESGKSGEYAAEVFKKLNDPAVIARSGRTNLIDSMFGVGPMKSESALNNLNEIIKTNAGLVGSGSREWQDYGGVLGTVVSASVAATESSKQLARQQERSAKATEAARKAASTTAHAFVGLGDSLNDAKVSLGDWIKDMQKQADALRNFRVNAQKAAKQGLDEGLIKSLQEAGPEGALRMRQLANATDSEIKRANKAWRSGQAEIRKYVDATDDVPGDVSTRLTLKGMAEAMSWIAHFQRELNSIDRNIDVFIRAHTTRLPSAGGMGPQVGYAGGGYTGDMSATSIAGVVHGREFVFDAETTAANRALFEAIHAGYGATIGTAVTAGAIGSDATSVAMLSRIVNRLERVESAVQAAAVATGEVVGAKVNGAANSGYGRAYG